MTFNEFQQQNGKRAANAFPRHCMDIQFLLIAICGEVGEMANFYKKHLRGDHEFDREIIEREMAKELADIITYCDLLMTVLDRNTEIELAEKWNEVSKRRNWPVKIYI